MHAPTTLQQNKEDEEAQVKGENCSIEGSKNMVICIT
jgi:hypothetical protein